MKKIILFTTMVLMGLLTLQSFNSARLNKKDGAEPGYTGSPGDTLKNCTACHGGIATNVDGWITSNIPIEGYIPNNTYKITATNTVEFATRFGFEVSPQNLKGDLMGMIVPTDTFRTKLVGNDKYITYTKNGIAGQDVQVWSFDWVAPAAGSGEVVFYGAFNSNFNQSKAGDQTYLSKLSIQENTTASIGLTEPQFLFYPNPASDQINIVRNNLSEKSAGIEIIDQNGKLISHKEADKLHSSINISQYPAGLYFLRITEDGKSKFKRFKIEH